MAAPEIILASGSPRRRSLLAALEIPFTVAVSDIPEWDPEYGDPGRTVLENARRKGVAIAKDHPDACVIAADTTVALEDRLFAKPADLREADAMLAALSGQEHQVLTALVTLHAGRMEEWLESSRVRFKDLSPATRQDYLNATQPLDKAGAYAIQDKGDRIISSYEGSYTNIVGLPVEALANWLESFHPGVAARAEKLEQTERAKVTLS